MKKKFQITGSATSGNCCWCGTEGQRVRVVYTAKAGSPNDCIPFLSRNDKPVDISSLADGIRWKPDSCVQKDYNLDCTRELCSDCIKFHSVLKKTVIAVRKNAKRRAKRRLK